MMFASCSKSPKEQQAEELVVRYEFGLPVDSFRIDTCVVKDGETLGGMLNRLGATRRQITGITLMPRSEFDVRTIRPGKTYYALFQADTAGVEQLCYYVYKPSIREDVVLHLTDSMHVERFEKPITSQDRAAEVVIETSLWNAMVDKNLPPELAIELSDIYAWTIDFFGLQKGDSIRVYYGVCGSNEASRCSRYHIQKTHGNSKGIVFRRRLSSYRNSFQPIYRRTSGKYS